MYKITEGIFQTGDKMPNNTQEYPILGKSKHKPPGK